MPILTLQRQATELGRIRIGKREPTSNGGTRPAKLKTFRFTSASRTLIDAVAAEYGGEVTPWQPSTGAAGQWEVYTAAAELPVLMPPQPVSQWYESWSAGGCVRRCDGETEQLSDQRCLCDPDPARRQCLATTRLSVVLRDVPGVGVWRLESHGYYAAVELPALAEFLADAGGRYLPARLVLRERSALRGGKTLRYVVPGIEIEATPAQLMAARIDRPVIASPDAGGPLAASSRPALERAAVAVPVSHQDVDDGVDDGVDVGVWLDTISGVTSMQALTQVYNDVRAAGLVRTMDDLNNPIVAALRQTRDRLRAANATVNGLPMPGASVTEVELPPPPAPNSADDAGDRDAVWFQILAASPDGVTTSQITKDFTATVGVPPAQATAADMRAYLQGLTG